MVANRKPLILAAAVLALGHGAWAQSVGGGSMVAASLSPRVRVETNLGAFELELDGFSAPSTVLNFVAYVESGFYDGTLFHRVIPRSMIQGGSHLLDYSVKKQGLRPTLQNEWKNGLRNARGTIAMARQMNRPHSAQSGFYINLSDNEQMDRPVDGAAHTVFGKIVDGTSVVDAISAVALASNLALANAGLKGEVTPVEAVVIRSVKMVSQLDRVGVEKRILEFDAWSSKAGERATVVLQNMIEARASILEKEINKGPFIRTDSGLRYVDAEIGAGGSPSVSDTVLVHYRGFYADGVEFDNSRTNKELGGDPWPAKLPRVIPGWIEAISGMQVGGKRVMVIPPDLGYGKKGRRDIPPDATLFFEVELIGISSPLDELPKQFGGTRP